MADPRTWNPETYRLLLAHERAMEEISERMALADEIQESLLGLVEHDWSENENSHEPGSLPWLCLRLVCATTIPEATLELAAWFDRATGGALMLMSEVDEDLLMGLPSPVVYCPTLDLTTEQVGAIERTLLAASQVPGASHACPEGLGSVLVWDEEHLDGEVLRVVRYTPSTHRAQVVVLTDDEEDEEEETAPAPLADILRYVAVRHPHAC